MRACVCEWMDGSIYAGQANAATGTLGMEDSVASAAAVAAAVGIDSKDVLLAAVTVLAGNLKSTKEAAAAAATAICTTDLVRKSVAVEVKLGSGPLGRKVRVGGMGKGSGMIHPNMVGAVQVASEKLS